MSYFNLIGTKMMLKCAVPLVGLMMCLTSIPVTMSYSFSASEEVKPRRYALYVPATNFGEGSRVTVNVTNLEGSELGVTLATHDSGGNPIDVMPTQAQLGAGQTKSIDLQTLLLGGGSVKIESDGDLSANTSFEAIDGRRLEVLGAVKEPSKQLDFPSLVRGDGANKTLALFNPQSSPAAIDAVAFDRAGREIGRASLTALGPMETKSIRVNEVFGRKALKRLSTLRVVSDVSIVGHQAVDDAGGDLVGLRALTATSKVWTLPITSQVGELRLWTSVQILNSASDVASVNVEAFDAEDNFMGSIANAELSPGATHSVVAGLDEGVIPTNAATIRVSSDAPIAVYAVIGVSGSGGITAVEALAEDGIASGYELVGSQDGDSLAAAPLSVGAEGALLSGLKNLSSEYWKKGVYSQAKSASITAGQYHPLFANSPVIFPLSNWSLGCNPYWGTCVRSWHTGEDAGAPEFTPVRAPASGWLREARSHTDYGGTVLIESSIDGESVVFLIAHMNTATLQVREANPPNWINAGDPIGFVGNTSQNGGWTPHVHFAINRGPYNGSGGACGGWKYHGYTSCESEYTQWYVPSQFVACHANGDRSPDTSSFWSFNNTRNCWYLGGGAVDHNFSAPGAWIVGVRSDPQIISSPLGIDASRYKRIEISMASPGSNTTGQVFFTTNSSPAFSEDKSMQFTVIPGGAYQTYAVDFSTKPSWNGTIARLRIDPVANGNGQDIGLQSVRLLAGQGQGCIPSGVSIGQSVNATLTTSDCRSPVRGSAYYADRYSFNGSAGQQVAIGLTGLFDTYLYLIGPSGSVIAQDDDGGAGTNSSIPAVSGYFSLPSTGTYIVEVTSYAQNTTGNYTLNLGGQSSCNYSISPTSQSFGSSGGTGSVSVSAPSGCSWQASSSANWIAITSGNSGSGNGAVNYTVVANSSTSSRSGTISIAGRTFTVSQSGTSCTYSISPTSQSFSASGGTGSVSVTAPGGCSWTASSIASWISITSGSTGTGNGAVSYSVQGNGSSSRSATISIAGRTFTVSQAAGGGGGCTVATIAIGQTVSGSLNTSDCRSPVRGTSYYADRYSFSASGGQQVAILLTGSFDTYLCLIGPSGSVVAQDDDGGGGTNSRIPGGSGYFSLPSSGTYIIEVTSYAQNTTGSYAVSLSGQTSGCTVIPISIGQMVSGSLSTGDCRSPARGSSYYADRYSITGSAGQRVVILLTSPAFDTYLYLIGPSGSVIAQNDDGGGGTNSRIPAGGGFFTLPSTGTYTIEVTSYAQSTTGSYTLSVN